MKHPVYTRRNQKLKRWFLFQGYPFTKDLIKEEAGKDIPPLLRGEIWAALLNVGANYETDYLRIDKYTHTTTDRQVIWEQNMEKCGK